MSSKFDPGPQHSYRPGLPYKDTPKKDPRNAWIQASRFLYGSALNLSCINPKPFYRSPKPFKDPVVSTSDLQVYIIYYIPYTVYHIYYIPYTIYQILYTMYYVYSIYVLYIYI